MLLALIAMVASTRVISNDSNLNEKSEVVDLVDSFNPTNDEYIIPEASQGAGHTNKSDETVLTFLHAPKDSKEESVLVTPQSSNHADNTNVSLVPKSDSGVLKNFNESV